MELEREEELNPGVGGVGSSGRFGVSLVSEGGEGVSRSGNLALNMVEIGRKDSASKLVWMGGAEAAGADSSDPIELKCCGSFC